MSDVTGETSMPSGQSLKVLARQHQTKLHLAKLCFLHRVQAHLPDFPTLQSHSAEDSSEFSSNPSQALISSANAASAFAAR